MKYSVLYTVELIKGFKQLQYSVKYHNQSRKQIKYCQRLLYRIQNTTLELYTTLQPLLKLACDSAYIVEIGVN